MSVVTVNLLSEADRRPAKMPHDSTPLQQSVTQRGNSMQAGQVRSGQHNTALHRDAPQHQDHASCSAAEMGHTCASRGKHRNKKHLQAGCAQQHETKTGCKKG